MKSRLRTLLLTLALLLACGSRALAHEGPPYPIIVDKTLGPCVLSVWSDPDVGTGTFFFILEPAPGGRVPEDARVDIGVRPLSGRLPEAVYAAGREDQSGRVQFKALVPFDAQETWRVRVRLQSAEGGGEATTDVEVTPPGYGRWDLLIYLLPFAAVGFLWLRALVVRRRRGAAPNPPASN
ncbi:MAG TPA: hypothetical protein VNZ44_05270 [Pyrinomonadaceae bacterium]|nr:hypothetical protein [Pyrinomonadaceae bacterium]